MIDSVNLKQVGRHLPRPRAQRGELSDTMPKRGKLTRGRYWARWHVCSVARWQRILHSQGKDY